MPLNAWIALPLTALALCAGLVASAWATGSAHARPDANTNAAGAPRQDNEWLRLGAQERTVLAPLASQWGQMSDDVQDKWIGVARRYPTLSADGQARVRDRMKAWSAASPTERNEARLRFQKARELAPAERQQKWEAYQALPADKKAELLEQAKAKQAAANPSAPSPGQRQAAMPDRKTNLVPTTPTPQAAARKPVSAAVVKAGPGATTQLMTQSAPKPPLYQHSGLPKIAATKPFVDPQTMLPKKGPQSAGMTPVATSSPSP
ncbi:DUF3106 domain-containing protein [Aquabacterium lacunae]|uniref:DUF3106 domain-containing protein n=1 Tax=Aquabacterium lacunae TaxID=2528630 RepID=A0A4Q9H5F4_9BURK|nr:DUF3106 domain-containing protein [Aquabacterium lacunae]TBO32627.1 DUF3106 domain-containing protein [Aquabacterium lacunae]